MTLNNRKINATELLSIVNNSDGVSEGHLLKMTNANPSRLNSLLTKYVDDKLIKKEKVKQNIYAKSKIDFESLEKVDNLVKFMDLINKFRIKYSQINLKKESKTKEKYLLITTIFDFKDVLRKYKIRVSNLNYENIEALENKYTTQFAEVLVVSESNLLNEIQKKIIKKEFREDILIYDSNLEIIYYFKTKKDENDNIINITALEIVDVPNFLKTLTSNKTFETVTNKVEIKVEKQLYTQKELDKKRYLNNKKRKEENQNDR